MNSTPAHPRLNLAPHVRACKSDGQVILLDLRRSQYLGLGPGASRLLADQVDGWPIRPNTSAAELDCAGACARQLLAKGLLTTQDAEGQVQDTIEIATTSAALDGVDAQQLHARTVGRFARSAATSAWWLRHRSMAAIAASLVELRKRTAAASESVEDLTRCTALYEMLRPFAFTARQRCLHDSLALTHFLASNGLLARWIVGVKTGPFGAHSWVQSRHTVLNDQHEYVRRFHPILVM